ncbi:flagellar/basal body protein [Toxoplasma gondii MAS]|uniref:Flagellar/basal body protein n=2 Tax=Toxoplasma gondii TaxID=5811 RepID=A0A086Q897_TOXGO|nr:flagellar/basal body protein [Toxoplasma gondii MAS]
MPAFFREAKLHHFGSAVCSCSRSLLVSAGGSSELLKLTGASRPQTHVVGVGKGAPSLVAADEQFRRDGGANKGDNSEEAREKGTFGRQVASRRLPWTTMAEVTRHRDSRGETDGDVVSTPSPSQVLRESRSAIKREASFALGASPLSLSTVKSVSFLRPPCSPSSPSPASSNVRLQDGVAAVVPEACASASLRADSGPPGKCAGVCSPDAVSSSSPLCENSEPSSSVLTNGSLGILVQATGYRYLLGGTLVYHDESHTLLRPSKRHVSSPDAVLSPPLSRLAATSAASPPCSAAPLPPDKALQDSDFARVPQEARDETLASFWGKGRPARPAGCCCCRGCPRLASRKLSRAACSRERSSPDVYDQRAGGTPPRTDVSPSVVSPQSEGDAFRTSPGAPGAPDSTGCGQHSVEPRLRGQEGKPGRKLSAKRAKDASSATERWGKSPSACRCCAHAAALESRYGRQGPAAGLHLGVPAELASSGVCAGTRGSGSASRLPRRRGSPERRCCLCCYTSSATREFVSLLPLEARPRDPRDLPLGLPKHAEPWRISHVSQVEHEGLGTRRNLAFSPGTRTPDVVVPPDSLVFDSRFESGNLKLAVQSSSRKEEYLLLLRPDAHTGQVKTSWFFFSASMQPHHNERLPFTVTFKIANLVKSESLFAHGMRPLTFSVAEQRETGAAVWRRSSETVKYYRNRYPRSADIACLNSALAPLCPGRGACAACPSSCGDGSGVGTALAARRDSAASRALSPQLCGGPQGDASATANNANNRYSTLEIAFTFRRPNDTVYFASGCTYTYSHLLDVLHCIESHPAAAKLCSQDALCATPGGLVCPVLCITNPLPDFSFPSSSPSSLASSSSSPSSSPSTSASSSLSFIPSSSSFPSSAFASASPSSSSLAPDARCRGSLSPRGRLSGSASASPRVSSLLPNSVATDHGACSARKRWKPLDACKVPLSFDSRNPGLEYAVAAALLDPPCPSFSRRGDRDSLQTGFNQRAHAFASEEVTSSSEEREGEEEKGEIEETAREKGETGDRGERRERGERGETGREAHETHAPTEAEALPYSRCSLLTRFSPSPPPLHALQRSAGVCSSSTSAKQPFLRFPSQTLGARGYDMCSLCRAKEEGKAAPTSPRLEVTTGSSEAAKDDPNAWGGEEEAGEEKQRAASLSPPAGRQQQLPNGDRKAEANGRAAATPRPLRCIDSGRVGEEGGRNLGTPAEDPDGRFHDLAGERGEAATVGMEGEEGEAARGRDWRGQDADTIWGRCVGRRRRGETHQHSEGEGNAAGDSFTSIHVSRKARSAFSLPCHFPSISASSSSYQYSASNPPHLSPLKRRASSSPNVFACLSSSSSPSSSSSSPPPSSWSFSASSRLPVRRSGRSSDWSCTSRGGSSEKSSVSAFSLRMRSCRSCRRPLVSPWERPVLFISARVHPGESSASWVLQGLLAFLLAPAEPRASLLRETFRIFVVPMLNVDGVVRGNSRCALCGQDLNRVWREPDRRFHPSIFCAKALLHQAQRDSRALLFLDLHAHSTKLDVFMYCNAEQPMDAASSRLTSGLLPSLLEARCPWFGRADSSFRVEKSKEGTGRVVCGRDVGIACSYTLEASFFGPTALPTWPLPQSPELPTLQFASLNSSKTSANEFASSSDSSASAFVSSDSCSSGAPEQSPSALSAPRGGHEGLEAPSTSVPLASPTSCKALSELAVGGPSVSSPPAEIRFTGHSASSQRRSVSRAPAPSSACSRISTGSTRERRAKAGGKGPGSRRLDVEAASKALRQRDGFAPQERHPQTGLAVPGAAETTERLLTRTTDNPREQECPLKRGSNRDICVSCASGVRPREGKGRGSASASGGENSGRRVSSPPVETPESVRCNSETTRHNFAGDAPARFSSALPVPGDSKAFSGEKSVFPSRSESPPAETDAGSDDARSAFKSCSVPCVRTPWPGGALSSGVRTPGSGAGGVDDPAGVRTLGSAGSSSSFAGISGVGGRTAARHFDPNDLQLTGYLLGLALHDWLRAIEAEAPHLLLPPQRSRTVDAATQTSRAASDEEASSGSRTAAWREKKRQMGRRERGRGGSRARPVSLERQGSGAEAWQTMERAHERERAEDEFVAVAKAEPRFAASHHAEPEVRKAGSAKDELDSEGLEGRLPPLIEASGRFPFSQNEAQSEAERHCVGSQDALAISNLVLEHTSRSATPSLPRSAGSLVSHRLAPLAFCRGSVPPLRFRFPSTCASPSLSPAWRRKLEVSLLRSRMLPGGPPSLPGPPLLPTKSVRLPEAGVSLFGESRDSTDRSSKRGDSSSLACLRDGPLMSPRAFASAFFVLRSPRRPRRPVALRRVRSSGAERPVFLGPHGSQCLSRWLSGETREAENSGSARGPCLVSRDETAGEARANACTEEQRHAAPWEEAPLGGDPGDPHIFRTCAGDSNPEEDDFASRASRSPALLPAPSEQTKEAASPPDSLRPGAAFPQRRETRGTQAASASSQRTAFLQQELFQRHGAGSRFSPAIQEGKQEERSILTRTTGQMPQDAAVKDVEPLRRPEARGFRKSGKREKRGKSGNGEKREKRETKKEKERKGEQEKQEAREKQIVQEKHAFLSCITLTGGDGAMADGRMAAPFSRACIVSEKNRIFSSLDTREIQQTEGVRPFDAGAFEPRTDVFSSSSVLSFSGPPSSPSAASLSLACSLPPAQSLGIKGLPRKRVATQHLLRGKTDSVEVEVENDERERRREKGTREKSRVAGGCSRKPPGVFAGPRRAPDPARFFRERQNETSEASEAFALLAQGSALAVAPRRKRPSPTCSPPGRQETARTDKPEVFF